MKKYKINKGQRVGYGKDSIGIQWKYNNKSYLTDIKVNAD